MTLPPLFSWPSALLVLTVVDVVTFARAMTGGHPHLTWRQTHHAYYGWAMVVLGFLCDSLPLMVAGKMLANEDSTQHYTQSRGYSPVHFLWRWIARLPFAQRLGVWADTRFKRRGT